MINFIKKILGFESSEVLKNALQNGAVIIDVRSEGEFKNGHIKGSVNIPLQKVSSQIQKIKGYNKKVVLCCASGMRSSQATSILKNKGIDAVNGGSWQHVNSLLANIS